MSDSATVQPGNAVEYVPHVAHWNHHAADGRRSFALVRHAPGHPSDGLVIDPERGHGGLAGTPEDLHTAGTGHGVRVGNPLCTWPARVVQLHDDGTADLEIADPLGGVTLAYSRVPQAAHDPDNNLRAPGILTPHSWHVKGT